MELRLLTYFLAIAEEGAFIRAAEVLHISQPALTQQMHSLEEELGVTLFERTKNGITLTEEGVMLKRYAKDILALTDKAKEDVSGLSEHMHGEIFIGSAESSGFQKIADMIKQYNEQYPHVKFHIVSGDLQDLEEQIINGTLDLALIMGQPDEKRFRYRSLPESDYFGVLMRKDDALAEKTKISPKDLKDKPLIIPRQQLQTGLIRTLFRCHEDALNIRADFNLFQNAHMLVEAGIGYAITFDQTGRLSSGSPLTFIPFTPKITRTANIIWKDSAVQSRHVKAFIDLLIE